MDEMSALRELLAMLVTSPRTAVLFALLLVAAVSDYRTMKVPNWLTLGGAAFAVAYNTAFPLVPSFGLAWTLGGLVAGLLLMLPMYALGALGAGDVKLMAMVGAFVGLPDIFSAALASFITGGVAAIAYALYYGSLGRMLSNVTGMLFSLASVLTSPARRQRPAGPAGTIGKLPYGISIAIGSIGFVVANQLGYA